MKQIKHLLVLFFYFIGLLQLQAQLVEGTPCTATCLDPTKSVITGRQPNQNNQSPNQNLPCGSGTSEDNPAWWIVRPSGNSLTFSVTTSNCVAGGCGLGVQMTLWEGDNCGSVTAIDCVVGTSGTFTSSVTPCKVYYLQVDGLCECQCNVILTYDKNQILKEVPKPEIKGPKQVCKGVSAKYCATIPGLNGCRPDSYKWTLDPASAGTITKIAGDPDCVNIKFTNPPANGKVKICVEPVFSGKCPPKVNKECFEVEVLEIKPAICDVDLCPEERPVVYELIKCVKTTNPTFTGTLKPETFLINFPPGTKKTQKISYTVEGNNCPGEVTLNINVFDNKPVQLPPLILCEGEDKTIKGIKFACPDAGSAPKKFVQDGNPKPIRCDTAFEMLVQCIKITPKVTGQGTLDCSTKQLTLNAGGAGTITLPNSIKLTSYEGIGKREYQWSKNGVDIVGATNPTLVVTSAGTYAVTLSYTYEVIQTINGKQGKWSKTCSKVVEVIVKGESGSAIAETPNALNDPCANGTATYSINPDPLAQQYTWSVTNGATIVSQSTDPNGKVEVVVQNNGNPYQVCLVKKACDIVSAPVCINVNPIPGPVNPVISGKNPVCQGDSTCYSIGNTSAYTPNVDYTWTVTGGVISSYNADSSQICIKWSNVATSGEVSVTVKERCGTATSKNTVAINNLPVKPSSVAGKRIVCLNDIEQYTVGAAQFATGYQWYLSGGGTMNPVNGQSDNVTITWNTVGIYQLCVKSINSCLPTGSDTFCIDIDVRPIPIPSAGTNKKVCAKTTTLGATISVPGNTGKWTLLSGPGTATFGNTTDAKSSVEVTECGIYQFVWTESNGTCSAPDTVDIRFSEPPRVKSLVYACNNGVSPKTYDVTIVMEGCDAPFTVPSSKYPATINGAGNTISILGVPQTDNNWSLIVSNAAGCFTTVNVVADCNCDTRAGTMKIEPLKTACEDGGKIKATHNGDEVNDGNDTYVFALHEGTGGSILNQVAENKTGEFEFDPLTMECGKTYYISYVIANNKNDKPDPQDKCLQVTPSGQPVRWDCVPTPDITVVAVDTCKLEATLTASPGLNGSWSVAAGNTGVFNPNITSPNTIVSDLKDGKTTFKWKEVNGTCSATAEKDITIVPKAGVTFTVDTICSTDGKTYQLKFTLNGTAPFTLDSGSTATGSFSGTNMFTTNPVTAGTKIKLCFKDALVCRPTCAEFEPKCPCLTNAGQMAQNVAGACIDGKITLSPPTASSGLFLDSDDTAEFYLHTTNGANNKLGTVIAHNTTGEFTFIPPMIAGTTYYVSYVVGDKSSSNPNEVDLTDGCLDVSLGQPIVFHALPTASAKDNSTICKGSNATIVLTFTGKAPFEVLYTANALAQTPLTPTQTTFTHVVNPNETTNYAFTKITDGNGCVNNLNSNIEVIVNNIANPGIPSPDRRLCIGTDTEIDLEAELNNEDAGGTWSMSPLAPDLQGTIFKTKNTPTGTYTFTYTVKSPAPCPTQTANFKVTIDPNPVADAGPNQDINCDVTEVTIGGNSSKGISIAYSWVTLSGDPLTTTNILNPSTRTPGKYLLRVTDNITKCFAQDEVEVTKNTNVITDFASTMKEPSCFGEDNGSIDITKVEGGTPNYTYSINNGPFLPYKNFVNLKAGVYDITIKDSKGCRFPKAVTVTQPEEIDVAVGDDVDLELGDEYTIQAQINFDESLLKRVVWTPTCDECLTAPKNKSLTYKVQPNETTLYTVTITNQSGCVTSDNILLRVNKPRRVYIPNIFYPDSEDDRNRKLKVFLGADVLKVHYFRVYDRWGNAVYEDLEFTRKDVANQDKGWDGQFRGQRSQAGVYTYGCLVEFIDGYKEVYKGDVLLVEK